MDLEELDDLLEFLGHERSDVRAEACKHVLSLTGSEAGISSFLLCKNDVCNLLVRLLGDIKVISLNAAKALVNLSSNELAREKITQKESFWSAVLEGVLSEISKESEQSMVFLQLLTNMTRTEEGAKRLLHGRLGKEHLGHDVKQMLLSFYRTKEYDEPSPIDSLLPVLTNITQLDTGRDIVLSNYKREKFGFFKRLLHGTTSKDEQTRLATVNTIRNMCFSSAYHFDLLTDTELVERVLVPLLGPEGIEDDDETVEVPALLQEFLSKDDKEIEKNSQIRKAIIDTLFLLTATRKGRIILRKKKCYPVIKAYHVEEEDSETSDSVFKLVDILLGEEDYKEMTKEDREEEQRRIVEALGRKPSSDELISNRADADQDDYQKNTETEENVLFEID